LENMFKLSNQTVVQLPVIIRISQTKVNKTLFPEIQIV